MSPTPSKSALVILDTGPVIEAFRTKSWEQLIQKYAITLSRTVLGESLFYQDADGKRVYFDLNSYVEKQLISVIEIPTSELKKFLQRFDPTYIERLHAGELESLCYMLDHCGQGDRICSGDGIVYKVLGKLMCSERGISLEELLNDVGYSKPIREQFSKKFRESWASKGFQESKLENSNG
jgi:hypothetical protein